ncbi:hypothetical protein RUND412_007519 [Rhizina undulata]
MLLQLIYLHLLYVSQKPALAHCVREIIYPWRYIASYSVMVDLARYRDEDLWGYRLNRDDYAQLSQLSSRFAKWHHDTFYTPQVELEESGECVTIFETALPRMPDIRRFCPGVHFPQPDRQYDKWHGTLSVDQRQVLQCWNPDKDLFTGHNEWQN